MVFMKRRASLDRRAFAIHAENQEHVIQMILGIRDLKQYRAESKHRSQWNDIQLRKFQVKRTRASAEPVANARRQYH